MKLKPEDKIIFKIYQKFAFANEDISKRQILNDISYLAAKEKGVDVKYFNALTSIKFNPNNSFGHNVLNSGAGSGPQLPGPLTGTPIK